MILTQGNGLSHSSGGQTVFYYVDVSTNPFTFQTMFTIPYSTNSFGYDPVDNYLYAFPGVNSDPTLAANTLLRVDANGNYDVIPVTAPGTAPGGGGYKGGTVDDNEIYYLSANTDDNALYYIDLKATGGYVTKRFAVGTTVNLPDIAWNPQDGKLYGVENSTASSSANLGKLVIITPTISGGVPTGATVAHVGKTNNSIYAFGAMYLGSNGVVYGSLNQGGFYQFNVSTGARVKISDSPSSSTNDGANCPLLPIRFGADISVTKTDNTTLLVPGQTYTYKIVVKNSGPFGAADIQVSDTLPAGIPAANVTYTAVAGGNATTTVTGANTGAINDMVSLEYNSTTDVGDSVVYTVILTVPDNYKSYVLTNYVSAMPNQDATIDWDLSNNEAWDTNKTPYIPINPHVRGWIIKQ